MRLFLSFLALLSAGLLSAGSTPSGGRLVTTRDLAQGGWDRKRVTVEGWVVDQFDDELSPEYRFLQVEDAFGTIYAAVHALPGLPVATNDYVGLRVRLSGIWRNTQKGKIRRYLGHELSIKDPTQITVLDGFRQAPFDVPLLDMLPDLPPERLPSLGSRRTTGQVLAVRNGDEMLIRTRDGFLSRIEFLNRPPPKPGDFVEVVGNVETDVHCINLSRARWRAFRPWIVQPESPRDVTARQIVMRDDGLPRIRAVLHGQTVRMRACVRSLPDPGFRDGRFTVESDGITCTVDAGNCLEVLSNLAPGAVVEVTGVCWMDIENWRPNASFPKIRGYSVVLRTADDIRILARPPWWTTPWLLWAIGVLLALLVWFAIWNRALRRLAERRGRELFRAQAARMKAELKTTERSRLAVELHDAISQTLTGVALKIKAAQNQARTDLEKALGNLSLAESTLRASREELRYCLWDLRNNILDLQSLEEAVRQTLRPQTGEAELVVRFPVSRRSVSDNTTHAVLQIVRELAVNAIRHGGATSLRVAGSLEGDTLAFSVQDNGCGFDAAAAPGPEQGHFGLLGVRDRLARFNGTLEVTSAPGKGTRAVVRMKESAEAESE